MKREELKAILGEGVDASVLDKIMAINGQDIEKEKGAVTTLQTELDGLKKQLGEANTAIEGFKKLDPEALKTAVDEWKTKAEQAEAARVAEVQQLRFDHALDGALTGAKAKNPKAVKAMLNTEALRKAFNEADGSIPGLEDQLKKVRETDDYLFESDTQTPRIVKGGDPATSAAGEASVSDAIKNALNL